MTTDNVVQIQSANAKALHQPSLLTSPSTTLQTFGRSNSVHIPQTIDAVRHVPIFGLLPRHLFGCAGRRDPKQDRRRHPRCNRTADLAP
jgi:hypothetical protein